MERQGWQHTVGKLTELGQTAEHDQQIVDEGRRAALAGASPFSCPYIRDQSDHRFNAWVEGFRTAQEQQDTANASQEQVQGGNLAGR